MHINAHTRVSPAAPQAVESPTRSSLDSKPFSDADRNEICLFFVRKKCNIKGNGESRDAAVLKQATNCICLLFIVPRVRSCPLAPAVPVAGL